MAANNFPEFRTVDEAVCFNCGAPLDSSTVEASGMPFGHGEQSAKCSGACELRTWFDVKDRR